ncbi:MAG: hypothetical protein U0838_08920 [Chloroflexota bacterium]
MLAELIQAAEEAPPSQAPSIVSPSADEEMEGDMASALEQALARHAAAKP